MRKQIKYRFKGSITVNSHTGLYAGQIFLNNGSVIGARTTFYEGNEALFFLMFITDERPEKFSFYAEAGNIALKQNITITFQQIARRYPEYCEEIQQVRKLGIKLNSQFCIKSSGQIKNTDLNKFEFQILEEIISHKSPYNLWDHNKLNEIDLCLSIHGLISKGIISEVL